MRTDADNASCSLGWLFNRKACGYLLAKVLWRFQVRRRRTGGEGSGPNRDSERRECVPGEAVPEAIVHHDHHPAEPQACFKALGIPRSLIRSLNDHTTLRAALWHSVGAATLPTDPPLPGVSASATGGPRSVAAGPGGAFKSRVLSGQAAALPESEDHPGLLGGGRPVASGGHRSRAMAGKLAT